MMMKCEPAYLLALATWPVTVCATNAQADSLRIVRPAAFPAVSRYQSLDSLKVGETIKADYYDFLQLLRSKKPIQEKQADIRDNYFGTYWYYYYKR
jgi:hypothetical protein